MIFANPVWNTGILLSKLQNALICQNNFSENYFIFHFSIIA
jgi:hypothetical protein